MRPPRGEADDNALYPDDEAIRLAEDEATRLRCVAASKKVSKLQSEVEASDKPSHLATVRLQDTFKYRLDALIRDGTWDRPHPSSANLASAAYDLVAAGLTIIDDSMAPAPNGAFSYVVGHTGISNMYAVLPLPRSARFLMDQYRLAASVGEKPHPTSPSLTAACFFFSRDHSQSARVPPHLRQASSTAASGKAFEAIRCRDGDVQAQGPPQFSDQGDRRRRRSRQTCPAGGLVRVSVPLRLTLLRELSKGGILAGGDRAQGNGAPRRTQLVFLIVTRSLISFIPRNVLLDRS